MMEVVRSSEMLGYLRNTRHCNTEDYIFHIYRHEILNSNEDMRNYVKYWLKNYQKKGFLAPRKIRVSPINKILGSRIRRFKTAIPKPIIYRVPEPLLSTSHAYQLSLILFIVYVNIIFPSISWVLKWLFSKCFLAKMLYVFLVPSPT
jgi:hypothetical protein